MVLSDCLRLYSIQQTVYIPTALVESINMMVTVTALLKGENYLNNLYVNSASPQCACGKSSLA